MAPLSLLFAFYSSLAKSMLSLAFARLYAPQKPPRRDLTGQIAIVTGANSGIGLSISTELVAQGATVYLACRSLERGNKAVEQVISKTGEQSRDHVFVWQLDIGNLTEVRSFCSRWKKAGKKIDMLVHNAGIASPPSGSPTTTPEGLDVTYTTNFLGSFLLTQQLESDLTPNARVVFTSSTGHYSAATSLFRPYVPVPSNPNSRTSSAPAYAKSKAQQVLFASLLQRHFDSSPRNRKSAHAFTPGFTSTPIFSKFDVDWRTWIANPLFSMLKATEKFIAVDTDEGAKTGSYLATSGENLYKNGEGGKYWEWCTRRTSLIDFLRGKLGEQEWEKRCKDEWKLWERDAGTGWEIDNLKTM